MKIKILTPNEKGNFEFTKTDLEKLLKEAYDDGYSDGIQSSYATQSITPHKPWWQEVTYCNSSDNELSSVKATTEGTVTYAN